MSLSGSTGELTNMSINRETATCGVELLEKPLMMVFQVKRFGF